MLRCRKYQAAALLCVLSVLGCGQSADQAPRDTGRAPQQRLAVESRTDDVERIDPVSEDDRDSILLAQLVADRPVGAANPMRYPQVRGEPAPMSPSAAAQRKPVARAIAKDVAAPRVGAAAAVNDTPAKPGDKKPEPPKLFEGWPKPEVALVITGLQNGYLEPCGCAGLENMKGGLMRRHTFLKSLQAADGLAWPTVVTVDLGNLAHRFGWQAEQKYYTAVKSLTTMKYDAIGYGPDDLRLGLETLALGGAEANGKIVSANVALSQRWDDPARMQIVERGKYKIGVTHIVGDSYLRGIAAGGGLFHKKAADGLKEVIPKLLASGCQILVLLSHAPMDETKALAKEFPHFHVVVCAGGPDEPPLVEERIPGTNTWIIESGKKGMYLQVVGFYRDREKPRRFQRVPIDSRFKDSPEIKKHMVELQQEYKNAYDLAVLQKKPSAWEGLRIRPLTWTGKDGEAGRTFVGTETCAGCHTKAAAVFAKTGHAHATDTLAKLEIPRMYDAECLSCHVTGWEPQKFVPFKSGFESLAKTAHLTQNGCENCHGPGSRHVEVEGGEFAREEKLKVRAEMRVTIEQAKKTGCTSCHDPDNSPDYVKKGFDAYWPKIEHKGKD